MRAARRLALGTSLAAALGAPGALAAQALAPASAGALAADAWRARAEVTHASADLQRARELGRRGMMSDAELDDRRLAYDRARAEWLRTALAALGASRHVVIDRATKRRRADGTVLVRLALSTVVADTPAPPADGADDLRELLAANELRDLVVSVKADAGPNGAAIGRPYDRVVPRLAFGARATVEFELLEDVGEVVIATTASDRTEERRVRLENDGADAGVSLRAAQFSLEGELGTEVVYDLTLEPSARRTPVLRLSVDGLPPSARAEFREAASKTRIVQVRMPEGAVAQHLQLAVTLPPASADGIHADSLVRFAVVALANGAPRELARLPLEIVGRGAGRVELQPASLFVEAAPGDTLTVPVRVRNVGTRALSAVRVTLESATRWDAQVLPDRVERLAPGAFRTVQLRVAPPRDTPTGEYELRLGVDGDVRESAAAPEDRVVRVRVAPRGGMLGTGALLAAFAAVGVALVVFGRRLVYR